MAIKTKDVAAQYGLDPIAFDQFLMSSKTYKIEGIFENKLSESDVSRAVSDYKNYCAKKKNKAEQIRTISENSHFSSYKSIPDASNTVEETKRMNNDDRPQIVASAFQAAGLKFTSREKDSLTLIEIGNQGKNSTVIVDFVFSNDDPSVYVRSHPIARIPADKLNMGYELMNTLNLRYRFVRWYIDKDGDIAIQLDIFANTSNETLAKVALEVFVRISQISDEAYPTIMRQIWS